jgi:hypothetical protein
MKTGNLTTKDQVTDAEDLDSKNPDFDFTAE